jgi:hypothetical protein
MDTPKHSRKAEGVHIGVSRHNTSPHDSHELLKRYYSGYIEIVITYTRDSWYVNPRSFSILLLRPMDSRQSGLSRENNNFVYALSRFESYKGFSLEISHTEKSGAIVGCDKFTIKDESNTTNAPNAIVIPHNKGIIVPDEMICS